ELVLTALSIWWLVYFNRFTTKTQFIGEEAAATHYRRPVSITIIAWLMIAGILYLPFVLLTSYPAFAFGFVVKGGAAKAVYLLFSLTGLAIGIGLLQFKPPSHALAVAFYAVALANIAAGILVPGSFDRMQSAMTEFLPANQQFPLELAGRLMWFGMMF